MPRRTLAVPAALAALAAAAPSAHAQLVGPLPSPTSPYLRFATDSPFAPLAPSFAYFFLERFETGALTVPGVGASAGAVLAPGGTTDSVDEDDAVVDGSGTNGHSWFFGQGSTGVTWTFNVAALPGGVLPTHVGIVWTDGGGSITFEAFDQGGASLGTRTGSHADGSFGGTTGEDRFYGATNAGGISSFRLSNSSGGIEMDHLQFGRLAAATTTLPEPSAVALLGAGLLALGGARRRRRR